MIVVFDASTLVFLFTPDANAPTDPSTGRVVGNCQVRIKYLIADLQKAKAQIIIPAPALAEVLVYAEDAASEWLNILNRSRHFRIAPFDQLEAVECAAMANVRRNGPKPNQALKRKAKFDEQIVAIARTQMATLILSDDNDIKRLVGDSVPVRGMADLLLPPEDLQTNLFPD
ncbi:MAG: hypothetical protein EOO77_37260 [Oxalobacteraceae bacterium]|nr:MAG: hypothetical protein EOO77_37260 [Oxalobacteraceae bacterium]